MNRNQWIELLDLRPSQFEALERLAIRENKTIGDVVRDKITDQRKPKNGTIYVTSFDEEAEYWRGMQMKYPIKASWIDFTEEFYASGLFWRNCLEEAAAASVLIVQDLGNKGLLIESWAEVGAALNNGVPVLAVGRFQYTSIVKHPGITAFENIDQAMAKAMEIINGT
jgi:hypothetical protein